jgi:hypothetical protein
MALDPKEIMRRFPIGRILELQDVTKARIIFLGKLMSDIDLVQRMLADKFRGENATGEAITEAIDNLLQAKPFEGMVSIALGNGWNGPDAFLHAQTSASVLRKIVWSLIYADVVTDYDICRADWLKLKLSLLENPPGAGVLVCGYEFKEAELGHKGSGLGSDICPDFPPASFLDEEP